MAVDGKEGPLKKVKDFFWQDPEEKSYQDQGGDDRVPEADRHGNPLHEANDYAAKHGEPLPYPELAEGADGAAAPARDERPSDHVTGDEGKHLN